ncbi:HlyD family type I secretion periplasmic adaptor subunit [Anaeromusa sp.]|uniref:HlyD family type I secretion periplasmic adaptor subunit n=1 Tax=Anaeromusa sp. TaxID=1872520 RepID=UPI002619B4FB|nr:HlyD family type I secretion periplasmic adaptor subunit [Anaeromusa sp.]MDD3158738.1 HlyD family type I secretion periplasmic adaptor subunit [Anaeromusa sp.]
MIKKLQKWIQEKYFGDVKDTQRMEKEEAEFLPAVLEVMETPPSPVGRAIQWTLFALVIAGLIWMVVGEVDEVAVAPGKLIPNGYVKMVQSEDKGVVRAIHVKDGDFVKQGQPLIELSPTASKADLERLRKEAAYYQLDIERLQAELTGSLFQPSRQPGLDPKDIDSQLTLYSSRMAEYRSRMAMAAADIAQQQSAVQIARTNLIKFQQQFEIARDKEDRIRSLLADNAVAYFTLLDHQSKRMELEQSLVSQQSEIAKSESALAQSLQNRDTTQSSWLKDINTKLVEDRKQLASYQEELKKAEEKNAYATLVAPIDGRVNQLAVHTVGAVVTEAQPLMTIVPEGTEVEVEVKVANKDIGFIYEGQQAAVKVDSFSFQKFGVLEGVVKSISPDAIDDQQGKNAQAAAQGGQSAASEPYYRVLVTLPKQTVNVFGREQYLLPGMTAQAEIKIREKRIIEFFMDPFRKYTSEALRER